MRDECDIRIGDDGQEPRSPVRLDRDDREPGRIEFHLVPADPNRAAIRLAEQIVDVGGDDLDDAFLKRFPRRKARRLAHGRLGPFGIPPVELGEAAQIGRGVVHGLVGESVGRRCRGGALVLAAAVARAVGARRPAPSKLHGRRRAEIGTRCHGCDMACVEDVGARARRPCPAGAHKGDDRRLRGKNFADDLAHGAIETAGGIHPQDDEPRFPLARCLETQTQILRGRRSDCAAHFEKNGGTSDGSVLCTVHAKGRGHRENERCIDQKRLGGPAHSADPVPVSEREHRFSI